MDLLLYYVFKIMLHGLPFTLHFLIAEQAEINAQDGISAQCNFFCISKINQTGQLLGKMGQIGMKKENRGVNMYGRKVQKIEEKAQKSQI